jgi:hypothetical protein
MAFEHKNQPLLSRDQYLLRVVRYVAYSSLLISGSLAIGILGYHYFNYLSWIDSLLNASMILSGMGPTNALTNTTAKIFASFYSIFSGVVFLSTVAVFLSPIVHRFLHRLHLDEEEHRNRLHNRD